MTKADIAMLLCRVIGLYYVVNAIHGFCHSLILLVTPLLFGGMTKFTAQMVIGMALPQCVALLVGLVVWRKAPEVGKSMAR